MVFACSGCGMSRRKGKKTRAAWPEIRGGGEIPGDLVKRLGLEPGFPNYTGKDSVGGAPRGRVLDRTMCKMSGFKGKTSDWQAALLGGIGERDIQKDRLEAVLKGDWKSMIAKVHLYDTRRDSARVGVEATSIEELLGHLKSLAWFIEVAHFQAESTKEEAAKRDSMGLIKMGEAIQEEMENDTHVSRLSFAGGERVLEDVARHQDKCTAAHSVQCVQTMERIGTNIAKRQLTWKKARQEWRKLRKTSLTWCWTSMDPEIPRNRERLKDPFYREAVREMELDGQEGAMGSEEGGSGGDGQEGATSMEGGGSGRERYHTGRASVCFDQVRGRCGFGDRCRFSHAVVGSPEYIDGWHQWSEAQQQYQGETQGGVQGGGMGEHADVETDAGAGGEGSETAVAGSSVGAAGAGSFQYSARGRRGGRGRGWGRGRW